MITFNSKKTHVCPIFGIMGIVLEKLGSSRPSPIRAARDIKKKALFTKKGDQPIFRPFLKVYSKINCSNFMRWGKVQCNFFLD